MKREGTETRTRGKTKDNQSPRPRVPASPRPSSSASPRQKTLLPDPASLRGERLEAVTWLAISKLAEKKDLRDAVPDGAKHKICLRIHAEVDDLQTLKIKADIIMSVGCASQQANSSVPSAATITAYFLGMLSERKRKRILRDLAEQYEQNDHEFPGVSAEDLAAAKGLLSAIRATDPRPTRGPVNLQYVLSSRK